MTKEEEARKLLDTSDVDNWIGVPLGGGHMKDALHVNDIRRWAQGHQNPNPLFFDELYAAQGRFGGIVAPYSFTVCTDDSHGAAPAIQGTVEGTHMLFGGDEWWFFGPRIVPGDHLVCHRMPYDYKVRETKFAGPTCFQRGDTLYINQRGERVGLQRSTSIRYAVREAKEKKLFEEPTEKDWSDDELAKLDEVKGGFIRQIHELCSKLNHHAFTSCQALCLRFRDRFEPLPLSLSDPD